MTELEQSSICQQVLDTLARMERRMDRQDVILATLLAHDEARQEALLNVDLDRIQIERSGSQYMLWSGDEGAEITKELYDLIFDLAATTGHEHVVRSHDMDPDDPRDPGYDRPAGAPAGIYR